MVRPGCNRRGLRQDRRFNRERHILCVSGCSSSHDPARRGKDRQYRSNFAVSAWKGRVVYCGAKADVHELSRAMSLEWASQGVVVNVVAPCITETASRKPIIEKPGYKEWVTKKSCPVAAGISRKTWLEQPCSSAVRWRPRSSDISCSWTAAGRFTNVVAA